MTTPCARCRRPMHPAQNSRRAPDGIICMACYEGPTILWREPRTPLRSPDEVRRWFANLDNPELN